MTLCEKIKLIDELIREDPDHTIKDYLELVDELMGIQKTEYVKSKPVVVKISLPEPYEEPKVINRPPADYTNETRRLKIERILKTKI